MIWNTFDPPVWVKEAFKSWSTFCRYDPGEYLQANPDQKWAQEEPQKERRQNFRHQQWDAATTDNWSERGLLFKSMLYLSICLYFPLENYIYQFPYRYHRYLRYQVDPSTVVCLLWNMNCTKNRGHPSDTTISVDDPYPVGEVLS